MAEQPVRDLSVPVDAASPRRGELGVRRPAPVLVVAGTTTPVSPDFTERLLPVLKAVVGVAAQRHAVLVTGGTDAGVFHVLRLALDSSPRSPEHVIGVAPGGLLAAVGPPETDQAHIDERLSALVRVDGDRWGDETPMLSRVVAELADDEPSVVLLIGGGDVSRAELVEHLRRGRALVIITETGRLADDLAAGITGDGDGDADLRALLASGNVKHVALSAGTSRIASGVKKELGPPVRRARARLRRRWRTRRQRWAALSVFPRWRYRAGPTAPLLDGAASTRYPSLAERAAEADGIVYPAFAEHDTMALVEQNRFRWFAVLAIFGGLFTTIFGAAQAWLQSARWPGVVVATLAAATTALSTVARRQDSRENYLTARLRAERLRSLYFENLTRSPIVDADADRRDLAVQVAKLRSSKPI